MINTKFIILAESQVRQENLEEVKSLSAEFEKLCLEEHGCEAFYRTANQNEPTKLCFFEIYSSKEEFDKHKEAPYTKMFFSTLSERFGITPIVTILTDL